VDRDFNEHESFTWFTLNPEECNRDVHLGWRWPASELQCVRSNDAKWKIKTQSIS